VVVLDRRAQLRELAHLLRRERRRRIAREDARADLVEVPRTETRPIDRTRERIRLVLRRAHAEDRDALTRRRSRRRLCAGVAYDDDHGAEEEKKNEEPLH